jgi:hypothetical protein
MNAYAPALLVDIQTDEDRLTRKIKFVIVTHGKSPFGGFFSYPEKTITENLRLAFPFSSIRSREGGHPGGVVIEKGE